MPHKWIGHIGEVTNPSSSDITSIGPGQVTLAVLRGGFEGALAPPAIEVQTISISENEVSDPIRSTLLSLTHPFAE